MIRFGLIGLGHIVEHHLAAIHMNPETQLVAVCDSQTERMGFLQKDIVRYSNHSDLIADTSVDVVIVATPTQSHADIALEVLHQRKPLLLEKPATLSLERFIRLRDFSEKNSVPVFTLFHAIYGSEVGAAKTWIQEHGDGSKNVEWQSTFVDPYEDIPKTQASLVNSWVDSGINALSIIQTVLEPVALNMISQHHEPSSGRWASKNAVVTFEMLGPYPGSVIVECAWERLCNRKSSVLTLGDKLELILKHSDETLITSKLGYQDICDFRNENPRLTNHYVRAFKDAINHIMSGTSNWDFSQACHEPYFSAFGWKL